MAARPWRTLPSGGCSICTFSKLRHAILQGAPQSPGLGSSIRAISNQVDLPDWDLWRIKLVVWLLNFKPVRVCLYDSLHISR